MALWHWILGGAAAYLIVSKLGGGEAAWKKIVADARGLTPDQVTITKISDTSYQVVCSDGGQYMFDGTTAGLNASLGLTAAPAAGAAATPAPGPTDDTNYQADSSGGE